MRPSPLAQLDCRCPRAQLGLIYGSWRSGAAKPAALRVDGGMTENSWLCQFLADILQCPVERPRNLETTALGAAFHAGLATGLWSGLGALSKICVQQDSFLPSMDGDRRAMLIAGWKIAVERALTK